MHRLGSAVLMLAGALVAGSTLGRDSTGLSDAELRAYMARPYDKAALMNTTVPLGRYRGAQLVAEFPCADVCPSHTVRIVHFVLPPGVRCADVGGVMGEVLVPVVISMRSETFCMPPIVANAGAPAS